MSLTSRPPSVTFKTPMVPRCSAVVVWLLSALGSPLATTTAAAQAPLVEEAVAGRVLARADVTALAEGEAAEAHALGLVEGAWPNPDIGYTREETFGNGGSGEDYAWASQRIDVSGRLFMRRDAGDRRAGAARIAGEQRRADLAAAARMAFYGVLAADARAEALGSWCVQISAALRLVEARERAGDAAPYDETRLRRELRAATARRDEAAADRSALEAELASLLGEPTPLVLSGQLRPPVVEDGLAADQSPALRSLREMETAASLDREASARAWIPELTLGAGYKGVTTYGAGAMGTGLRVDGLTLNIGLSIPLFDTGSASVARDEARGRVARASLELGTLTTAAQERGLVERVRAMERALDDFEAGRAAEAAALVRVASAAYEGGEGSLLELLDAHRSVTEDALFAIDLAIAARAAFVELAALRGEP